MSGSLPIRFTMSVRAAISNLYATNPRAANAFTGGCTFTLGDLTAQRLEMARGSDNSSAKRDLRERTSTTTTAEQERNRSYDFYRAAQLGLLGVVMNGVFLYTWYTSLDRIIGSSRKSKLGVAAKVAADQFIYAPFAITTFFYFMSIRKHRDVALANGDFAEKMQSKFFTTYMADCMLWPCSNFVNFRFVPLPYRPSFTAIIQFIWQTYLSYTSNATRIESAQAVSCQATLTATPSGKSLSQVE